MHVAFLIFTILCPPFGIPCGLYGVYKDKKHWLLYVFCLAISMATIAYCYMPKGDPDIVRYFDYVERLKGSSLEFALNNGPRGEENLYTFTFVAWIIGQIGDIHMLPALSTFIVYFTGFYITCRVGNDMKVNRGIVVSYIIFIIVSLNFYSITNNVRNVCAFSLMLLAIFRDVYLKKHDIGTILLYILPIFLHPSAVILIAVRFAIELPAKLKFVMLIIAINVVPLLDFMQNLIFKINYNNAILGIVKTMMWKANYYFIETDSAWGDFVSRSTSYRIERYSDIGIAIIFCFIIVNCRNNNSIMKFRKLNIHNFNDTLNAIFFDSENNFEKLTNCVFFLAITTIACFPMRMPEYWRFYTVTVLSGAMPYFILASSDKQIKRVLAKSIFVISPLCFIVTIRFLLYSNLEMLIFDPFLSSPVVVLIRAFIMNLK